METLKDFASVPQAKIDGIKIECQARQIESLNAKLEDRDGQIEALDAKAIELAGELDAAKESESDAKALIVKADEAQAKMTEDHATALAEAKKVKDSEVAAKAAELMAEAGHPAIPDEPNNDLTPSASKMTEDEFWNKYESIPVDEQNAWYTENSHLIK